ncbi:hypothetical protein LCGC14_2222840 [marine sediment metagenome]|uniref:Uncharacterized protein n=1 Tax=marine sediment metagenome TaxID=412755 RepID=A0A0F9DAH8_9ZZZZ
MGYQHCEKHNEESTNGCASCEAERRENVLRQLDNFLASWFGAGERADTRRFLSAFTENGFSVRDEHGWTVTALRTSTAGRASPLLMSVDVRGLPPKVWLVIRPTGERHFINKIDDITEWAEGVDVTVAEYQLTGVVHTPPQKPPKKSEG